MHWDSSSSGIDDKVNPGNRKEWFLSVAKFTLRSQCLVVKSTVYN